jgi:deazaflavin-dependent oxidoreductase (nitroreductase family)
MLNQIVRASLRVGLSPPHTYLLTVHGRKSGALYSTPVRLIEQDGKRWLVAPYGEVAWVRNARAARQVRLARGSRIETVAIREVAASEAAPVLQAYLAQVPIVRPFFDVKPDSDLRDFAAEAPRHPVFRIE